MLFSLSILFWAFQQPVDLKRTKISDQISAKLPEEFRQVSEDELSAKYISYRKPIALYTSPDRLVDFSVNVSVNQWQHFDLPIAKDFYKASLGALYSELEMIKEETREVGNHPAAVFEFIGTVEGEEGVVRSTKSISKYNYIAYVLVEGKIAVFALSAPAKLQQKWSPVAEEIIESLKIKKTL